MTRRDLRAYLDRIGFSGEPHADLATLTALHRAHLLAIAYENLDVALGVPTTTDIAAAYDKIVRRGRGGWCFEMNGLFGWALSEIGFAVTRAAGGVLREKIGDDSVGGHLVLLVDLDQRYVVDVGFGDGLFEPAPLQEGPIAQRGFISRLEQVEGGWWRYHNHQHSGAPTFDFQAVAADPEQLSKRCAYLQTSPASPFTQNIVLQRHFPDRIESLRNALRFTARPDGMEIVEVQSADDFCAALREVFCLDIPAARELWPRAQQRGKEMLAEMKR